MQRQRKRYPPTSTTLVVFDDDNSRIPRHERTQPVEYMLELANEMQDVSEHCAVEVRRRQIIDQVQLRDVTFDDLNSRAACGSAQMMQIAQCRAISFDRDDFAGVAEHCREGAGKRAGPGAEVGPRSAGVGCNSGTYEIERFAVSQSPGRATRAETHQILV